MTSSRTLNANERVKLQIGNLVVALAEAQALQEVTQARLEDLLEKAAGLGIDLEPKPEVPKP